MSLSSSIYTDAARAMQQGGIIAYPTEGVWGLGCDPLNRVAVNKILTLKSRSVGKGLILVASDMQHLSQLLSAQSPEQLAQIESSRGQGITWLVEHGGTVPAWISGGQNTLAVRLSDHPAIAGLCEAFGGAIVSTSANRTGKPPATSQVQVAGYFGNLINVIVAGKTGSQNGASEIRELKSGRIIRRRGKK